MDDELDLAESEANDLPCDTLVAVQFLTAQFPKHPNLLQQGRPLCPFVLLSQIYASVPDRTSVDREILVLQSSGAVRLFRLPTPSTESVVVLSSAYDAEVTAAEQLLTPPMPLSSGDFPGALVEERAPQGPEKGPPSSTFAAKRESIVGGLVDEGRVIRREEQEEGRESVAQRRESEGVEGSDDAKGGEGKPIGTAPQVSVARSALALPIKRKRTVVPIAKKSEAKRDEEKRRGSGSLDAAVPRERDEQGSPGLRGYAGTAPGAAPSTALVVQNAVAPSVLKCFREAVLPNTRESTILKSELLRHLSTPHRRASDKDITLLMQAGLLTRDSRGQRGESFCFAIPNIGSALRQFHQGRKELLRVFQKAKHKEVSEAALEKRKLAGSFLGTRFHIRDLIGQGQVVKFQSTNGGYYRLVEVGKEG